MNIGISNHYPEQVSVPSINGAEVNSVEKSKKKWSDAENAQLSNYIKEFGENWRRIAEKMPGTTPHQCKRHWIYVLNPTIKHEKWTKEEEEQLKNLVDQHGEKWIKIAKEMPGRTNMQCREHYKISLNPAIKQGKWTEEEDEQLQNLVKQHGEKWAEIAKEMSSRTHKQCWQRYTKTLNPAIKQGKWTEEEDEQLQNLVDQYGEKWTNIAKEMSGRTDLQCRQRYKLTLNSAIKHGKWTEEEDEQLQNFVTQHGEKWAEIATKMSGRTDLQCSQRYKLTLNPAKQGKWTEEEDEQLQNLVDQHGEKWAEIAKEMSSRTHKQCWQRYTKTLNPAIKQGKWTEEEDEQLQNLVDQYGENWAKIAKEMSSRTDHQCSQRYKQTLNPAIKHGKWTKEENEQLQNLVDQYGENWAKITKEMSSRTDHQCSQHYRRTLNPAIKKRKWTEEEENQLKEAVQRIGEDQWVLVAQEFSDKTPEQCVRYWQILNSKSNKKHSRSEINYSLEERPLKKFKKNHAPQLLELDKNGSPLNRHLTQLDQPQLILFNQAIPQYLVEPVDAIVLTSTVQQSFTRQDEPFIAERYLSPTDRS